MELNKQLKNNYDDEINQLKSRIGALEMEIDQQK